MSEREHDLLPPESVANQAIAKRLTQAAQTAIQQGKAKKPNLVWLELTGCSGNIISLMDGFNPDIEYMISSMVNLVYSNSLMAAQGEEALQQLFGLIEQGEEFILAVEGAVATRNNGMFHVIGRWQDQPLTALSAAQMLGAKAKHVIAVGACATHGGVSAAKPNPSASVGLPQVLERPVIKLPGCPCHPDWFLGTLAHLLLYGEPALDAQNRPLLFYSSLIHDRCPRRTFYNQGIFAETLGEETCLFKLGCRGPVTRVDCPTRQWNGYVDWPIGTGTPCIGCAQIGFPDQMEPFIAYDTTRDTTRG